MTIKEISLLEVITRTKVLPAPTSTIRYGKHLEWLVAIGKDETATITMTVDAYDELLKRQNKALSK